MVRHGVEQGSPLTRSRDPSEALRPYLPRLVIDWLAESPEASVRRVDGTLVYVDISGFTSLTERLARLGRVGAEEMSDVLNESFSRLLDTAYDYGAGLVKWGGDAVFLLFDEEGHAIRACRAAYEMRATLRQLGQIRTSAGAARLRMSIGVHSGEFVFLLAGDIHRELLVTGPAASTTARMETIATAGEILLSPATAALLPPRVVGDAREDGLLLRRRPEVGMIRAPAVRDTSSLDLASCIPLGLRERLLERDDSEHRTITVGFLDFSGADRVLASSGVDRLASALDALMRSVQGECARHGVTFWETDIGLDGGKIMLVAGAPQSTGEDEERMLRTVRAVLDAPCELTLRAGVNRGPVFSGDFGPRYRRTISVKGDAVNLAARLTSRAAPGELLATSDVLGHARTSFAVEELPPFSVKGKKRLVRALRVGGARRERVADSAAALPLIGRERELEALKAAVESARAGQGTLVELVGEPGMGRSRLLAELRAAASEFAVGASACAEYESSTPYIPFRALLSQLLGLDEGAEPDVREKELRRLVGNAASDLEPWLPLIGIPFGLELAPTRETEAVQPRFRRERAEEALVSLLAAALARPTLVVLDDVQWLDDASAALVRKLCDGIESRPWLVVVARRPALTGLDAGDLGAERIVLGPLEPPAAAALAEQVATSSLAPHVLAAIVERAEGNPMFVAELAARAGRVAEEGALPDSIDALLTAQIDRLLPDDRSVLRLAAVIGVRAPLGLLSAALADDGVVLDESSWSRLDAFLVRTADDELRFRNSLIRDAAYQRLPFARRRAMHALIGETIARVAAAPDAEAETLSLHFLSAQRYGEAWRYSRVAAERAQAVYASVEAATFLERALQAARHVPEIAASDLAAVQEALGDARVRMGEFQLAGTAFAAARRGVASDPSEQARLLLKEALVPWRLGRYPAALRWISRGLRALEGDDGVEAAGQRARFFAWKAAIRQRQGRPAEAIEWCRRAIAQAEGTNARDALAHASYLLDWAYAALGRLDEVGDHSQLALAIYEELGDFERRAGVLNNLGGYAYFQGRWDEAARLYGEAQAQWEQAGDTWAAYVARINAGEILSDQGRLAEAEPALRRSLQVARASRSESFTALAAQHLGRLAARSGRFGEAHELLGEARSLNELAGARDEVVATDARIAECLVLEGRPQQALALARRAIPQASALGGVFLALAMLERVRGLALAQSGRLPKARGALEESLRLARELGASYEIALALDGLAAVERLDGRRANELEAERDELLAALGVVELARPPLSRLAAA